MHDPYRNLTEYINFRGLTDDGTLACIRACFTPRSFSKKETLLTEGDVCHYNYFVNRGCLRFYSVNDAGVENTRYFALEGKFGTALSSFISREPSFEFIQAVESTEVLRISRDDFYRLVEAIPIVNLIYRDILEMAYVTSQRRIYNLQGQSALDRLRWLLQQQPDILSRLPSVMVASYLGVTPHTLSRLKAELYRT
jgi:CRP-like cAMP-binding protein